MVVKKSSIKLEEIDDEESLEPWADWMKQATYRVEAQARKLNLQSWVMKARAAKWKWALIVASHDANKWTCQVLDWSPELFFHGPRSRAQRKPGRPQLRWIDDIIQFVRHHHNSTQWQLFAIDAGTWHELSDEFCEDSWRNVYNM